MKYLEIDIDKVKKRTISLTEFRKHVRKGYIKYSDYEESLQNQFDDFVNLINMATKGKEKSFTIPSIVRIFQAYSSSPNATLRKKFLESINWDSFFIFINRNVKITNITTILTELRGLVKDIEQDPVVFDIYNLIIDKLDFEDYARQINDKFLENHNLYKINQLSNKQLGFTTMADFLDAFSKAKKFVKELYVDTCIEMFLKGLDLELAGMIAEKSQQSIIGLNKFCLYLNREIPGINGKIFYMQLDFKRIMRDFSKKLETKQQTSNRKGITALVKFINYATSRDLDLEINKQRELFEGLVLSLVAKHFLNEKYWNYKNFIGKMSLVLNANKDSDRRLLMNFYNPLDFHNFGKSISLDFKRKGIFCLRPIIYDLNKLPFLSQTQCRSFIEGIGLDEIITQLNKESNVRPITFFLKKKCFYSDSDLSYGKTR